MSTLRSGRLTSELESIAARLRDLADDTGRLSGYVEDSARRLRDLGNEVDALRRSGVDVGTLASDIGAASGCALTAAETVQQVKAQGHQWADEMVGGAGSGGAMSAQRRWVTDSTGHDGVQSLDHIAGWLGEINQGFTGNPWDPRSNNCGQCALAVFQRLEDGGSSAAGVGTLSTLDMERSTGRRQEAMSPSEIESRLRAVGPGAHAVVGIDRASGPGHWFNAYFDGDKVVAIDGQTGTISGWPPDYGDVVLWDAGL